MARDIKKIEKKHKGKKISIFQNVDSRGIYQNGRNNEEKKMSRGGPITERLNFKINTEFKILGLKSKNEEEKNIRVKNFKMLTHVEYIKTVETMKTKMSRGEPITEKQHLKINTQYFLELKSTFFELKSMRENRL